MNQWYRVYQSINIYGSRTQDRSYDIFSVDSWNLRDR